jgi:hypothetical protein
MQLFAVVPLTDEILAQQMAKGQPTEIAVRLTKSHVNLRKIEQILAEKQSAEDALTKTNEALMTFVN